MERLELWRAWSMKQDELEQARSLDETALR